MALLRDGLPADIEVLRIFESGILEVAETEAIDLDAKLSLAGEETADAIFRFLLFSGTREVQQQRRDRGVNDVVVTPALRRWHALKTLEHVYQDAYGHQLNERYSQKLKEYQAAVRAMENTFFARGVGVVLRPVPRPDTPKVLAPGADPQAVYLAASWTGAAGEEGAASTPLLANLGAGGTVAGPAFGWNGGWNLYAGATPGNLTLQNEQPLPCEVSWTLSGDLNTQGQPSSGGQAPDYFVVNYNELRRG